MMNGLFSQLSRSLGLLAPDDRGIVPKLPPSPNFWLPDRTSPGADAMDPLFDFVMWVSALCTLAILSSMIWFAIRYRAKKREANQAALTQMDHGTTLELTWSIVPFLLVVLFFVWGFKGFVGQRLPPKDAYEIFATGQKWKWTFQYPGGYVDDRLHVPRDRDVRVVIKSVDVLHSLFIPEFRTKIDAVPGRFTELWFHARKGGRYPLFCAEYCGTHHSDMVTEVVVHEPSEFEGWLAGAIKTLDDLPPIELGQRMFLQLGCAGCHATDGTRKTGPALNGIFGKQETLSTGAPIKIDENYIRESVFDPQAKLVSGFPPVMPTFKGQLNDKQLAGLIEFIKSLK